VGSLGGSGEFLLAQRRVALSAASGRFPPRRKGVTPNARGQTPCARPRVEDLGKEKTTMTKIEKTRRQESKAGLAERVGGGIFESEALSRLRGWGDRARGCEWGEPCGKSSGFRRGWGHAACPSPCPSRSDRCPSLASLPDGARQSRWNFQRRAPCCTFPNFADSSPSPILAPPSFRLTLASQVTHRVKLQVRCREFGAGKVRRNWDACKQGEKGGGKSQVGQKRGGTRGEDTRREDTTTRPPER